MEGLCLFFLAWLVGSQSTMNRILVSLHIDYQLWRRSFQMTKKSLQKWPSPETTRRDDPVNPEDFSIFSTFWADDDCQKQSNLFIECNG
jgi:hypothetical protein